MLNFIIGTKGSGKTKKAHAILGDCVKNGGKALLVVPKQFTFYSDKGILHLLGPRAACEVEVLSFSRLAELVLQTYGGIISPIAKQGARSILMSLAIESLTDKLAVFAKHKNEIALVTKMLDTLDELKKEGISIDELEKSAALAGDEFFREKIRETVLILRAYEAVVAQNYFDDADLLAFVADRLRGKDFFSGKTVVLDGFAEFTKPEIDIILTMLTTAKDVYVTLCTDNIGDKDALSPFAYCNGTARRLRLLAGNNGISVGNIIECKRDESRYSTELLRVEKKLYNPCADSFGGSCESLSVSCCASVLSECDYVARKIKKLLRSGAYRCRDIAVCFRNGDSYENHLRHALKKYGVPLFEDKRQAVENQPLISFVSTLLTVAAKGFSSDYIFRLLKTGLTSLTAEEISEIENYCFMWDISGKKWAAPWIENPDGLGERFTDERQERLRRYNELRERIITPVIAFREVIDRLPGREAVRQIYNYLRENGVDECLKQYAISLERQGLTELALEQEQVWDLLMEALDEIACALGEASVSAQRLCEIFDLVIRTKSLGKVPDGFDEVLISSADRMLTVNAPVVFVMGLNSGVFPAGISEGGLFSPAEKDKLRNIGINIGTDTETAVLKERFLLYNALASAADKLYLSYSLIGASGEKITKSEAVDLVLRLFPSLRVISDRDEELIELVESDSAAFELMAKRWQNSDSFTESLKKYFSQNEAYRQKTQAIKRAVEKKPAAFENKEIATGLFGKHMRFSASRLEDYGKCPFLYFCRYGLEAKPRIKARLDASHSGTVIHYVLEMLLKRHKGKQFLELTDEAVREEIAEILTEYMNENMGSRETKTERFNYLYYRTEKILDFIMLRLRAEFSESDFEPCDFELRIGDGADIEPMRYTLENGTAQLNGFVDRVDKLDADGKRYIRIVDYKSGDKKFRLSDVLSGMNMQMLLYLVSIWRNGKGFYEDIVPAGVLYFPARISPCAAEREDSRELRLENRIASGQMNGLLVNEGDIISSMEKELRGLFIPAKLDKKTQQPKGEFITIPQLEKLAGKMDSIICNMGNSLHNGQIPAMPAFGSYYTDVCSWCDYSDICLEEDPLCRYVTKMSHKDCIEKLEGGAGDEKSMD